MITVRRTTKELEAVEVTSLEVAREFCNALIVGAAARIPTREGLVNAIVGDYIVVAEDGTCEVYPAEAFAEEFEEVVPEETE